MKRLSWKNAGMLPVFLQSRTVLGATINFERMWWVRFALYLAHRVQLALNYLTEHLYSAGVYGATVGGPAGIGRAPSRGKLVGVDGVMQLASAFLVVVWQTLTAQTHIDVV